MLFLFSHRRNVPPVGIFLVAACFVACKDSGTRTYLPHEDSTAVVYGPYRVFRLPVNKGVTVLNPVFLEKGPGDFLFAANTTGEVYRLVDTDGDGLQDEAQLYCHIKEQGRTLPGSMAYSGDTVYVGTREAVQAYVDQNRDGRADSSWTVFDKIPHSEHPYEWTSGLSMGPDGWLYFALTTDSWNAGASPDPQRYRGSILRVSGDGRQVEQLATGIRSVHGMDFHASGELFFSDNAGGGNPTEELNRLVRHAFYGHNEKKFEGHDSTRKPEWNLEMEVAPSQIVFNAGDNHFGGTAGQLFVAYYGPGERWKRGGIARVEVSRTTDGRFAYREFPVADMPKLSGIAFGPDKALYVAHHGVSDYWYNAIEKKSGGFYKLVYDETLEGKFPMKRESAGEELSANSIERGRQLYMDRACFACHAVDGTTELIGPNLKGIGNKLGREDILLEIREPSRIIKPSMMASRVTRKNGQVLLGRMVNADEESISLMLIGNQVVQIPRSEIARVDDDKKSLMYENLLNKLRQEDVNSLLDYLMSL